MKSFIRINRNKYQVIISDDIQYSMHMCLILNSSSKNCVVSFIADRHTLKAILPFAIKMPLNFNYSLPFHMLNNLIPLQKSVAPNKKKSPLRVIRKGDFDKINLSGNSNPEQKLNYSKLFCFVNSLYTGINS